MQFPENFIVINKQAENERLHPGAGHTNVNAWVRLPNIKKMLTVFNALKPTCKFENSDQVPS